MEHILEEYPRLTQEQVLAALAYAHDQLHDKYVQERIAS